MEEDKKADRHEEEEEESEYVLLDLDAVSGQIDSSPNASYTLSIGEYEETIGSCFVFSEDETSPVVHEETGPSEANLFSGKCIIDSNQTPRAQVKPVARLHKILKFRLLLDNDAQDDTNAPSNSIL